MRTLFVCFLLPLACSAQQFSFSARGHTYQATIASQSSSGLGFAGHALYEPSAILPSSSTGNEYVLLYISNTTAYTEAWPTGEAIYMQTSSDGLSWGSPTAVLSKASNICDMADARPIWDDSASLWRVFVQAVTYSGSTCGTDNGIYEATGSSLTSLSWYGSGGNASVLGGGDAGNPGIGESFQWFNTTNYDGPVGYAPIVYFYNDWNFTDPDYDYCPSCEGLNAGTTMFAYLTPDAETEFYYWYYTSVANAAFAQGSSYGYLLLYPDVLLGGTGEQSTLGPPGFSFGSDCTYNSTLAQYVQTGRGIGFYPTPVPNNDSSPSLPGQFVDGDWVSSVTGLITSAKVARNQYGFLDKTSSSPNTWQTYIYYNVNDEYGGTTCPVPPIQNTYRNTGGSGYPTSAWGVSQLTITEQ